MYVTVAERESRKQDIVDLLSKCKAATCAEISIKLGIPRGSCSSYLRELRCNHPNISAMKGICYIWVDIKEPGDTGICEELEERLRVMAAFIKKKGRTTYGEIVDACGVPSSTVHREVNRLKAMYSEIRTCGGPDGGVYWSMEDKIVFYGNRHINWVTSVLSKDKPKTVNQIKDKLRVCRATADKYVRDALEQGCIVKTASRSYVLPSDCPADKLNDDMILVWWYLKKNKIIARADVYKIVSCNTKQYINTSLRKLVSVSENVHAIGNGYAYAWEDK